MDKEQEFKEMVDTMDSMLDQVMLLSEKALERMATSTMAKSISLFLKKLYDELIDQGFGKEEAMILVTNFDAASFMGQKKQ